MRKYIVETIQERKTFSNAKAVIDYIEKLNCHTWRDYYFIFNASGEMLAERDFWHDVPVVTVFWNNKAPKAFYKLTGPN